MSPGIKIVSEVLFQDPFQMPLSQHDHVIEAFSANASDKPFRERILPRTFCCSEHLCDSHSLNSVSEMVTVDTITVSYQISRCRIVRKRFDDLLCRPLCSGMLRDIEMQHTTTLMRQHHEHKQHFQL